jgi:hypothetical protein
LLSTKASPITEKIINHKYVTAISNLRFKFE